MLLFCLPFRTFRLFTVIFCLGQASASFHRTVIMTLRLLGYKNYFVCKVTNVCQEASIILYVK